MLPLAPQRGTPIGSDERCRLYAGGILFDLKATRKPVVLGAHHLLEIVKHVWQSNFPNAYAARWPSMDHLETLQTGISAEQAVVRIVHAAFGCISLSEVAFPTELTASTRNPGEPDLLCMYIWELESLTAM